MAMTIDAIDGWNIATRTTARVKLGADWKKLGEAHENIVDPTAKITGGSTDRNADQE